MSKNLRIEKDTLGEHMYDDDEASHVYRCNMTGQRFKVRAGDPQPKTSPEGGDLVRVRTEHKLVHFEPSDRFLSRVQNGDAEAVAAAKTTDLAPHVARALAERQAASAPSAK